MIYYKFGDKNCKIDFLDFLCLIFDNKKIYKSEFENFSDLYEFIDKNKCHISYLLFDNYEYYLERGVLHNLYGSAYSRIVDNDNEYNPKGYKNEYFYIDGKLVCDKLDFKRGCKKECDFKNNEIFHIQRITDNEPGRDKNGKFYRLKEGVDYIKTTINLKERIKIDQRKKKLLKLNN